MTARLNWAFTPNLSFQLYGQPLLSSGDYTAYKQLEGARTYDFDGFEEGTFSTVGGRRHLWRWTDVPGGGGGRGQKAARGFRRGWIRRLLLSVTGTSMSVP